MNNKLEKKIESIEETFIWSDDPLILEDSVNALLEFDDELKDVLYSLVIKSVGTNLLRFHTVDRLHKQVEKTVRKYAEFQLEQEQ